MLDQEYFDVLQSLSDDDLLSKEEENRMRRDLSRANMLSMRSIFEQNGNLEDLKRYTDKFDVEDHKHQLSMDALIKRGFVYRDKDHVFEESGWYKKNQCSQCGSEVIGYSMCDDCWED